MLCPAWRQGSHRAACSGGPQRWCRLRPTEQSKAPSLLPFQSAGCFAAWLRAHCTFLPCWNSVPASPEPPSCMPWALLELLPTHPTPAPPLPRFVCSARRVAPTALECHLSPAQVPSSLRHLATFFPDLCLASWRRHGLQGTSGLLLSPPAAQPLLQGLLASTRSVLGSPSISLPSIHPFTSGSPTSGSGPLFPGQPDCGSHPVREAPYSLRRSQSCPQARRPKEHPFPWETPGEGGREGLGIPSVPWGTG